MVLEIADGLTYWTAPHPEWAEDDWPRDVGCVLAEVAGEVVLIDPLVDDWDWLDERVAGRRVHVLTTIRFHERDRAAVFARYDADERSPDGVDAFPAPAEQILWLPGHAALVPGDSLIADEGGLRLCPESWLRHFEEGLPELRAALEPLLDLPVERVLCSHGEPVLSGGRAALRAALSAPSPR